MHLDGSDLRQDDRADERHAIAVVVLAAGQGQRLAALGTGLPKWLASVAGRPIADYQLDAVEAVADPGDRMLVVAGYRIDAISAWLDARSPRLPLEIVENPAYAELNNWYSLLVALRRLRALHWSGSVVILNSDLCAQSSWYARFFRQMRTAPRWPAMLAVDFDRPLTDEAMKVATRSDPTGWRICTRIGKRDVEAPDGEYVGMAGFAAAGWPLLHDRLESFVDRSERADEWYEAAFGSLMAEGPLLAAWPTGSSAWVEIDDMADWTDASRLMAQA